MNLSIMKEAIDLMDKGERLAIVTIIEKKIEGPGKVGQQMIVLENGQIIGTIGGGIVEKRCIDKSVEQIGLGKSSSFKILKDLDDNEKYLHVMIQVHNPSPELILIGGGHVSKAVYNVMELLDFNITVMDDREEFVNRDRFPKASKLIYGDLEESLLNHTFTDNSYVVIATREHLLDEISLKHILHGEYKYVGMICSSRKRHTVFDNIVKSGIDKVKLESIHAPIGLNIANNTPEEIGVSIAAEILSVKNDKKI